jgi:hypothetical protein
MSDLTMVSAVTPAGSGIEPFGALPGDPPFAPIWACAGSAIRVAEVNKIKAIAVAIALFFEIRISVSPYVFLAKLGKASKGRVCAV